MELYLQYKQTNKQTNKEQKSKNSKDKRETLKQCK